MFTFSYPGQTYVWNTSNTNYNMSPAAAAPYAAYYGDIYSPASATLNVTVQQTAIPTPINSYLLPTSYWTRPIEGQNNYWFTVASNWLSSPFVIGQPPGTHQPGVCLLYTSDAADD